jgi:hypothetical protein
LFFLQSFHKVKVWDCAAFGHCESHSFSLDRSLPKFYGESKIKV